MKRPVRPLLSGRPGLRDVLALAFLLGAVLYLFKDVFLSGLIYYEADTVNFYYPIFVTVQEHLRRGIFPLLWTPNILGGFPLFADGEAGMLYPPNLAALVALPAAQAFAALMVFRSFLAAAFMYAFARTLDTGRLGAIVAAMVFSFGSFLIAQMHHANLVNGAIWLPLALLFVEKALRASGRRRDAHLLLAGTVLAMQMLAIHVQPVIMTLMAMALYACLRVFLWPLANPAEEASPQRLVSFLKRATLLMRVVLVPLVVGVSLAAVQLVPLYELSAFSFRGVGSDYRFATTYSSTVFNLVSLVFPYFFRAADGSSWSIWGAWEPTIYIGIAPLILAGTGILFVRSRYVLTFAVIAVVGLAISLGPYSPLPLHWLLWNLPGFSAIRAPGRFNFLFLFGAALLAAFAMRWLVDWASKKGTTGNPRRTDRLVTAYLSGWGAFGVWLAVTMQVDRQWFLGNKSDALWLVGPYVRLFDNPLNLSVTKVYDGLVHSLSLANPRTLMSFVFLAAALLLLWFGFRKSRLVGGGLLVLLVAVDLLSYGQAFHPAMPFQSLLSGSRAVPFLAARSERVFNQGTSPALEPNRLLPFDIPVLGGYSSLHPDRHREYEWWLRQGSKILQDLAGVRYVVEPRASRPSPTQRETQRIEGVAVDTQTALAAGGSRNPNSSASFPVQPVVATSVRVISTLKRAADIPEGEVAAEIVVRGEGNQSQTLRLRVGQHVSEWAYDRPDVRPEVKHSKAPVALTLPGADHLGRPQTIYLYYADLPLEPPMTVTGLDFKYVHPRGRISLHGLGLYNKGTGKSTDLRSDDRHRQVYQDADVVIYENTAAMPRAFLATSVQVMPSDPSTLGDMAQGDIDVTRIAIVEEEIPGLKAEDASGPPVTPAAITYYSPSRVTVEVETAYGGLLVLTDSYYPGWAALVNGQPQKVYRADYLFRGVPVGPGRHKVEFIYDPASLQLGAGISLGMALILLTAGGYGLWRRRQR